MWRSRLALAALAAGVAGCSSHAETVCQDIGDCSQGGDSVWIASCQAEAKSLSAEANEAGCGSAYDAYYACADDSYTCQGATALFPGCDGKLAALDTCLALASATAACGGVGADGGAGPDAGVPPTCTAARDCLAACYLKSVANVCAPDVAELDAANACNASCPP